MLNNMSLNLTGKNILVTGASSGIGRATAILISQLGAKVFLLGRDNKKLQQTFSCLAGEGHHILLFDLVEQLNELSDFLKKITLIHGKLNGFFHGAGERVTKSSLLLDVTEFEAQYRVNTSTAFALAKGFMQKNVYMADASLVFISSSSALIGESGLTAYASSKGALMSLTKSLAAELVRKKIRVNCVACGVVKTPLINDFFATLSNEQVQNIESTYPLGFGEPQDVAHTVAFLLSSWSSWMTGNIMVLDGGRTECHL